MTLSRECLPKFEIVKIGVIHFDIIRVDVVLHRSEDQVELPHLKENSDRPIDVTVDDGRPAALQAQRATR